MSDKPLAMPSIIPQIEVRENDERITVEMIRADDGEMGVRLTWEFREEGDGYAGTSSSLVTVTHDLYDGASFRRMELIDIVSGLNSLLLKNPMMKQYIGLIGKLLSKDGQAEVIYDYRNSQWVQAVPQDTFSGFDDDETQPVQLELGFAYAES